MDQLDKGSVSSMYQAVKLKVTGRVQGVGFRPFIYSAAIENDLAGTVKNHGDCVIILVEGKAGSVNVFKEKIRFSPPPLSKITEILSEDIPFNNLKEFKILESDDSNEEAIPWISGDAAICSDCLSEMCDPANRRFRFPFINCTQCGPRYTIIEGLPYDRPQTTMSDFEMCENCSKEYNDPADRRHHAQPICCWDCGPAMKLLNNGLAETNKNQEAVTQTIQFLKEGKIIGVKGLGGYHLACDAFQKDAIELLRKRKRRPQRPLAVMVRSLDDARMICHLTEEDEELLTSPESPIVLLRRRTDCMLPENLAPGMRTIGIMLPYTPLHKLLFATGGLKCLVMTSANPSGQPIIYRDSSIKELTSICEYILTHNREIHLPIDDSVVQSNGHDIIFHRRARGYVPNPLFTQNQVDQIVALGSNQKNTFTCGLHNHLIVSPHNGDLDNEETLEFFHRQFSYFTEWLGLKAQYAAVDKHPLYETGRIAKEQNLKLIPVQHHHAHHVSCMEDNGLNEPCLGIILDGTGYGDDGHIWGFEFLYGDAVGVERLAHLQYTPLPGGEKAVKEPWRNAAGMLMHYWGEEGKSLAEKLFPDKTNEILVLERMVSQGINTPLAGTCGRLFDAVSSILGICSVSTYEGEAAVKLSEFMTGLENERDKLYSFVLNEDCQLDFSAMLLEIVQDCLNNIPIREIVEAFHRTIAASCVETAAALTSKRKDLRTTVVLSGGSFQNIYLLRSIKQGLEKKGFTVFTHKNVPCNDGGLSVGQIIIASEILKSKAV